MTLRTNMSFFDKNMVEDACISQPEELQSEQENVIDKKWYIFGEVALNKDDCLLLFICSECNEQIQTFAQFLKHSMQHHMEQELDDNKLNDMFVEYAGNMNDVEQETDQQQQKQATLKQQQCVLQEEEATEELMNENFHEENMLIQDGALLNWDDSDAELDVDNEVYMLEDDDGFDKVCAEQKIAKLKAADDDDDDVDDHENYIIEVNEDVDENSSSEDINTDQLNNNDNDNNDDVDVDTNVAHCARCTHDIEKGRKPTESCIACKLKLYVTRQKGHKKFTCHICQNKFTLKSNLNRHLERHAGLVRCLCPTCGKAFITHAEMRRHIKTTHNKEKPYVCTECSKQFPTNYKLKHHMLRHYNERPYTCQLCKRGFYEKNALHCHLKTHVSERRFACHICDLKFKLKRCLKEHLKTHSNVKSYQCPYCNEGFVQSAGLAGHKRRRHAEMYTQK